MSEITDPVVAAALFINENLMTDKDRAQKEGWVLYIDDLEHDRAARIMHGLLEVITRLPVTQAQVDELIAGALTPAAAPASGAPLSDSAHGPEWRLGWAAGFKAAALGGES
jgi:hypothetical protein